MYSNNKPKLITLLLAFSICLTQLAYAQPSFTSPATCIQANPATSTTVYNVASNGSTINSVQLFGDLELVSVSPALPTSSNIAVTVKSKNVGRDTLNNCVGYLTNTNKNFGFGKGRIRVNYTVAPCNSFIEQNIFKTFTETPPIVGPKCVAIGDTVTYSVCSILSVNQNANIGIDTYTWGGTSTPNGVNFPAGLQLVYSSGDNSSVTFKVVAGWVGGTLYCKFGQCNTGTSNLSLGVKTQTSTVTINGTAVLPNGNVCVSTATTPINLVATAPAGFTGTYTYNWSTNNSSWSFGAGNTATATSSSGGTVSLNLNESSGTVFLTTVGGCNSRTDTFFIKRGLAAPLVIKRTDAVACITPGTNITFFINNTNNNANLSGLSFTWTVPSGWTIVGNANGPTITATAGAAGGNVTATANGCSGTLSLPVNVQPATPSAITAAPLANGCVTQGSLTAQTYSVTNVPTVTSYTWTNSGTGWTGSSSTNSITYTPIATATVGTISVVANSVVTGAGTCTSSASARIISFAPKLDSITVSGCWNVGILGIGTLVPSPNLASTPQFTPAGAQAGVTYTWSISPTTGGSFATTTTTGTASVTFNANGRPGTYTITCTPSNAACGAGTARTKTLVIAPNGAMNYIASNPAVPPFITGDYLYVTGAKPGSTFRWFSAYPGTLLPAGGGFTASYLFQNAATANTTYYVEVTTPATQISPNRYDSFVCVTVLKGTPPNFGARLTPTKQSSTLQSALDNITVTPNPASTEFLLQMPATTKAAVKVAVFSSKGELITVQQCKAGSNRFDTNTWPSGNYILQVTGQAGENTSRRIVIAK